VRKLFLLLDEMGQPQTELSGKRRAEVQLHHLRATAACTEGAAAKKLLKRAIEECERKLV
jgi:hypothetical protein